MIIGSCGAGKSTLSKKVAAMTQLPLIHLDKEFWQPEWVEPEKEIWVQKVKELVADEKWIIDGNYSGTYEIRLPRAELVVWLDFPMPICLWRVLKRIIINYGHTRFDMAEGCPERFDLAFIAYVLHFPWHGRKRILRKLRASDGKHLILQLKNDKEVNLFLERLRKM